jgi:hypothetical protein
MAFRSFFTPVLSSRDCFFGRKLREILVPGCGIVLLAIDPESKTCTQVHSGKLWQTMETSAKQPLESTKIFAQATRTAVA